MNELPSGVSKAYSQLDEWCRARDHAGYDPFDALNSRLFQATPLKHSRLARLVWVQFFKRSPINFRKLAMVPPGRNSKGTALFALAKLSEFRRTKSEDSMNEARRLVDDLCSAQIESKSGLAWGYNFDWQARAFFVPRGTPTVVPTAFAVRALVEATRAFDDQRYLKLARRACDFILNDLHRSADTTSEVCFSYTPLDRTRVFNASLLAAESLARVGLLTHEPELIDLAVKAARYVVRRQRNDGLWPYGAESFQSWCDNFHTAFNLTSLTRIVEACPDCSDEFMPAIRRGYDFWRAHFFHDDASPKLFHNRDYPRDVHSAAAAIVALCKLRDFDPTALDFAERVADWAIEEMQNEGGYFYYQRGRFVWNRVPYMRWSQAWMLCALSTLQESRSAIQSPVNGLSE